MGFTKMHFLYLILLCLSRDNQRNTSRQMYSKTVMIQPLSGVSQNYLFACIATMNVSLKGIITRILFIIMAVCRIAIPVTCHS